MYLTFYFPVKLSELCYPQLLPLQTLSCTGQIKPNHGHLLKICLDIYFLSVPFSHCVILSCSPYSHFHLYRKFVIFKIPNGESYHVLLQPSHSVSPKMLFLLLFSYCTFLGFQKSKFQNFKTQENT